jgi:hypothetical protein
MTWLFCLFARRRVGWWVAGAIPALTFAACCLNEQPAVGVLALPLVYLAVAPRGGPFGRRMARATIPPALGGVAGLVYALLYLSTAAPGMRGTPEAILSPEELPEHLDHFAVAVRDAMLLREFAPGALSFGWRALGTHAPLTLLWLAAFVAAAAPWLRRWFRMPPLGPRDTFRGESKTLLLTVAFGAAIVLLTWAPIFPIPGYGAPSRTCYVPFVGVLFGLGAVMDAGGATASRRASLAPVGRAIVAVALLWLVAAGSIMMVGVQRLLRERWRMDLSAAHQLAALAPVPATNTAFLPLATWDLPARTGDWRFDWGAIGAFRLPWSAPPLVRWVFGRADVTSGYCYRAEGKTREILEADASGLVFPHWLGRASHAEGEGRYRISWSNVVPFVVDRSGKVRLVSRVVVRGAGARAIVAEPEQVRALVRAGTVPAREFVLELPPSGAREGGYRSLGRSRGGR